MKCWHCNNELIWGGDHDVDEEDYRSGIYLMVTNLSCPNDECNSFVEVWKPVLELEAS
jgi:hypothetical protein